jgi:hypothetical protein
VETELYSSQAPHFVPFGIPNDNSRESVGIFIIEQRRRPDLKSTFHHVSQSSRNAFTMSEDSLQPSFVLTTDSERPGSLLISSDALDGPRVTILVGGASKSNADSVQQGKATSSTSPHYRITINDPGTLLALGKEMTSIGQTCTATKTPKALIPEGHQFTLDVSSIMILRIGILAPVLPGMLTPQEQNGGVDGPTMSSLVQKWREAFRSIPDLHYIERVQFDMRCREPHEPRHIVRFLQEISTVLYMKARRNLGREMVFEIVGCGEAKRRWLEASLPGEKSV